MLMRFISSLIGVMERTAVGSDPTSQENKSLNHIPGTKKETIRSKPKQKTSMGMKVAGENYR